MSPYSCFNENLITGSRDIIEQCQPMFDMLPVADQVFTRKVRLLLRFRYSENLICSLLVSNASNEMAFIWKEKILGQ